MRSTLFSAIAIASTISVALGAPASGSASVSLSATVPVSASAYVSVSASVGVEKPSATVDPRVARWGRMKIALPDGLLPEDKEIVPMMAMPDIRVNEKTVQKNQQTKGYKKIEVTGNGDLSVDTIDVTPLSPSLESDISVVSQVDEEVFGNGRRYKKFLGLTDNGEKQEITVPDYERTNEVITDEKPVYPLGVEGKTKVVVDKFGRMRSVEIPYYNRSAYISGNKE